MPQPAPQNLPEPQSQRFTAASVERRLIAIQLVVTGVVGVAATVVCVLVAGLAGLFGGLLGTVVVLGFFGLGQLVVARTLRTNPAVALNVAMLVYLVQIVVLFVLLLLLKHVTVLAPKAFAATIFAGVIAWTASALTTMSRTRVLYVEPDPDNTRGPRQGHGGGA